MNGRPPVVIVAPEPHDLSRTAAGLWMLAGMVCAVPLVALISGLLLSPARPVSPPAGTCAGASR